MAVFPTLSVEPTVKYADEIVKPTVKVEFEGNYAQTRPKYTRSMEKFSLHFRPITEADKTTLKTFFNTNSGNSFTWTNPTNTIEYTIRFSEDTLRFKYILSERYEITIPLEEV